MKLWRRTTAAVRPLKTEHRHEALEVCRRDPVASVVAALQAEYLGYSRTMGAQMLGIFGAGRGTERRDERPEALCWFGANLVPVEVAERHLDPLTAYLRRRGRRCSSIVGPAEQVLALWDRLEPHWSRPREVRADQPSMVIDSDPIIAPDPHVRVARADEAALIVPASVAMFTEEVGYDPTVAGDAYASRVAELAAGERTYVRIEDLGGGPEVIFKADVGALAIGVAQIQGVWVHPQRRGEGLGKHGMAAVVADVRARLAPTVSLYVNSYNHAAIATYERVGFRQVGSYATVLF